jgi:phthiocerol/phenolphthiocerol synthesis type-I polyketide synthase B
MMMERDVRQWIAGYIAELLDLPVDDIKPDREFDSYGLDSADAIIIGGALEEQFDIEIDATLFLRNSTIDALIADLRASGLLR